MLAASRHEKVPKDLRGGQERRHEKVPHPCKGEPRHTPFGVAVYAVMPLHLFAPHMPWFRTIWWYGWRLDCEVVVRWCLFEAPFFFNGGCDGPQDGESSMQELRAQDSRGCLPRGSRRAHVSRRRELGLLIVLGQSETTWHMARHEAS